jgi:hypothetical protein
MHRQMSDKGNRGWSGHAPRTVHEDAKNTFYRTRHLRVFWFSPTGQSAPGAGRSALGPGRCSLFHQKVRSVELCFCSVTVRGSPWHRGRSAARARTVRV